MKHIQLINDDYVGHVDVVRHACRGIVVKDGKVLLSYETNYNKFIIPGGGVEEGETYGECCERELLEETGMIVKATDYFLEIEELFLNWQHIQHYYICEYVSDTGRQHLTEAETRCGDEPRWIPFDEALKEFGRYEEFRKTAIEDYGLYRREYIALSEFKNGVKQHE